MTETSATQTGPSLKPTTFQHYVCYRTQPLGWQEAGYIVVTSETSSADTLPKAADNPDLWGNTAWVADPDHKYQLSHVYPELVSKDADKDSGKTAS